MERLRSAPSTSVSKGKLGPEGQDVLFVPFMYLDASFSFSLALVYDQCWTTSFLYLGLAIWEIRRTTPVPLCTLAGCFSSMACAHISSLCLTLPTSDNYGFVTYRYAEEAFAAIESGHKLRQADEQPFDLCFGGRRQFCKRSYSDLGEWRGALRLWCTRYPRTGSQPF